MVFHEILSVFETNNLDVKHDYKEHLQNKFHWLLQKYYPHSPPPRTTIVDPPTPASRVTVIDCNPEEPLNVTDAELDILSLGPKFALPRKVDESLIKKRLKWT